MGNSVLCMLSVLFIATTAPVALDLTCQPLSQVTIDIHNDSRGQNNLLDTTVRYLEPFDCHGYDIDLSVLLVELFR